MEWFTDFLTTFFGGTWNLFSIKWPGFDFTFGQLALAVLLADASLTLVLTMVGVNVTGTFRTRGGNNKNIKISKERSKDTK